MTIIEAADGTHGVAGYTFDDTNGVTFVADCGRLAAGPYDEVRDVDVAVVDCARCVAARLDTLRRREATP